MRYSRMAVVLVALTVAAGCGDANDSHSDISDDDVEVDMTPWTLVANFDDFPNLSVRCVGGDKVYTTTRASDMLVVVPNSPDCRDGEG